MTLVILIFISTPQCLVGPYINHIYTTYKSRLKKEGVTARIAGVFVVRTQEQENTREQDFNKKQAFNYG